VDLVVDSITDFVTISLISTCLVASAGLCFVVVKSGLLEGWYRVTCFMAVISLILIAYYGFKLLCYLGIGISFWGIHISSCIF
jgi:hypothetical protein